MATQTDVTATTTRWKIDPVHSEIGFSVKHMMVSNVRGRFNDVTGYIDFDPDDPTSAKIDVEIATASVDTRQEQRDNHLRSAEFFDAENHPKMSFVSKKVEHAKGDNYRVSGDLTIRDTTRPITLDASFEGVGPDPYGGVRSGFSATGKINRNDFGLNYNAAIEAGGVVVGSDIKIQLEVEAIKQA